MDPGEVGTRGDSRGGSSGDPIRLARMVNKIAWLALFIPLFADPIRLVRMVNKILGLSVLVMFSRKIFFTHVTSTWGSLFINNQLIASQSPSPLGQAQWDRKNYKVALSS